VERVAIVTGGTRGIGAAVSVALKKAGRAVVANYARDGAKAEQFSSETGIPARKWDVSDLDSCASAVAAIGDEFGPVDILVNNAGITRDATMRKITRDAWDQVLDTNLGGCSQSRLDRQSNDAPYTSGIYGFTKALAQEGAARGITVNAIAPGYIDTEMVSAVPAHVLEKIVARIPVGRLGQAGEIARGVVFLVADDAGFITGSTLSINGGQHMY
jgi:acetoacetyl-CoA reductase